MLSINIFPIKFFQCTESSVTVIVHSAVKKLHYPLHNVTRHICTAQDDTNDIPLYLHMIIYL